MKAHLLADWLRSQGLLAAGALPLRHRLYDCLQRAMLEGALPAGTLLPPTRELAAALGLARNTVLHAYRRLAREGYTVSRVGQGTRVAPSLPVHAQDTGAGAGAEPGNADVFMPGLPDVSILHQTHWARLLARAWRRPGLRALAAVDPRGHPQLRRALARHLSDTRGLRCEASRVLVTQDGWAALVQCARRLAGDTGVVWVEEPCDPGLRAALAGAGVLVQGMPVDAGGLRPMSLDLIPVQTWPRVIIVAPAHQVPSGAVMPMNRRRELLELASRCGAWILEDDRDGELRHLGPALPTLHELDVRGRTVLVGSLSRLLHPGLRLGHLLLPTRAADDLSAGLLQAPGVAADAQVMLQLALADFIDEGRLLRHLQQARGVYAQRQRLLIAELRRHVGEQVRCQPQQAGMDLTLHLAAGHDDRRVMQVARRQGLAVQALSSFHHDATRATPGLVLGYGAVSDAALPQCVARLAAAIGEAGRPR